MKKMNNKGFSLVELIIVIAIMAVLIGVLAPVYLKHVEDSKKSADLQNAQQIATALGVQATTAEGLQASKGKVTTITFGTTISLTEEPTVKCKGHTNEKWGYSYDPDTEGDSIKVFIGTTEVYPTASGDWAKSNKTPQNPNNNSGNTSGSGT